MKSTRPPFYLRLPCGDEDFYYVKVLEVNSRWWSGPYLCAHSTGELHGPFGIGAFRQGDHNPVEEITEAQYNLLATLAGLDR